VTAAMKSFVLRLCSPLPALTGIPHLGQDSLCIRIGHPEPLAFVRVLPPTQGRGVIGGSYELVMAALLTGRAELLNADRTVEEAVAALRALCPAASERRPASRARGFTPAARPLTECPAGVLGQFELVQRKWVVSGFGCNGFS
jgi:hypothetical protein